MVAFDITTVDRTADDNGLQSGAQAFDSEGVDRSVEVPEYRLETTQLSATEHQPGVDDLSLEKVLQEFAFQSAEVPISDVEFDRLGELADRFTAVAITLENEDGEPLDDATHLLTLDGFGMAATVTNSIASIDLLNGKPHKQFIVITEEIGTENLDFAITVTEPASAITAPGDLTATLVVDEPSLDLGTVMGRGDVLETLRQLLREEFTAGLQG